jgi:LuxR family maltose regulon positive regulatory protein
MQRRGAQVRGWLARFTDVQMASAPSLALCAAHAHLVVGDLGTAERWARVAKAALEASPAGTADVSLPVGVAVIEAAAGRRGVEQMGEAARHAYELADDASPWRASCCLLIGVSEHLAGRREPARAVLEQGARRSARLAPRVESLCLAQLALMAAQDDEWERACDLAQSAGARLDEAGLDGDPMSVLVCATSAWVFAHEGLAADAKRELRRSTRLLPLLGDFLPWYEVETRVALARAATRLADLALARTLLSQASRLARRMPDAAVFRTWLDEVWADIDSLGASALSGPCSLTMAELRILRFLPTHLSFREIGSRLHVSTNTVKSQAHAIYAKLDVASRSEAVARAAALGLIEVDVI